MAADAKAVAANSAAGAADAKAQQAQQGIQTTAKSVDTLRDDVRAGKFKMMKSDTVLFGLNVKSLSDEAKAQLDSFASSLSGLNRYVVEIQGFTDKTGAAVYNNELSQELRRWRGIGQPAQSAATQHQYVGIRRRRRRSEDA